MWLHLIAKALAVIGPLMAAAGAGLLTYDIMRGPVRWYDQYFFHRGRLNAMKRLHDSNEALIKSLPPSVYPADEIERMGSEATQKYQQEVLKQEEVTSQTDLKERERSLKLGLYGIGLVAIGSLFQSIAAILG